MYGGSGKLGRGGGGGGRTGGNNTRMSYQPPSAARPPGRLGHVGGGPRNNRLNASVNSGKPGSAAAGVEEQFSLVPGSNPLAYAMIIKLTPDLVEEIRKVETQGWNARIKFDAIANNTSENVIDAGGKDFRFTWSHEMGGLCDIYEERESGESGDGLLVESSCAWRKLNVQRVLDESTTSQVKMSSVEAELKHKSRQTIILDHGNPATKNQLKLLAAAESNPFSNSYTQKKEPPLKKRKFDSSPGGSSSRPLSQKPVLSSSSPSSLKSTRSASPLLSVPSRLGGSVSPYGASKVIKNHSSLDDPRSTRATSKEDRLSTGKEGTGKTEYGMHGSKGKGSAHSVDLHTKVVSILKENPKGMPIKALEVAGGDAFPNASKEIELIIGSIATFQPSAGSLKQGTESESSKDQFSEIEGLREHNHNQKPQGQERSNHQSSAQEASFGDKLYSEENEEPLRFNSQEDSTVEKKVLAHDPDVSGHPGSPDKSDDRAGSSSHSVSDSDSDTDSSDSRSDSESKSPVGSGSSSDSDSDASKNSKEGSDEDVDIISEDDKEQKDKLASSGQGLSSPHVPWRTPDDRPSQNSVYGNDEDYGPVRVEVEKILPDGDDEIEIDVVSDTPPYNEKNKSQAMHDLSMSTHDVVRHEYESYGRRHNVVKEHVTFSSPERVSKGKAKRNWDASNMEEKSDRFRRSEPGNLPPDPKSMRKKTEISSQFSPDDIDNYLHMDSPSHMLKRCDGNVDDGGRRSQASFEGQSGQLPNNQVTTIVPVDQKGFENMPNIASRNIEWDNVGHGSKNSERGSQVSRGFPPQYNKCYGDTQREDVGIRSNYAITPGSRSKKPETVQQYAGAQQVSKSSFGSSPKDDDRYPSINGHSKHLRRELSDLEMGELREPASIESLGINKIFEREESFKKINSKQGMMSDDQNTDHSKLIPAKTEPIGQGKVSSPTSRSRLSKNLEGSLNKRVTDKTKRPQQRTANFQTQGRVNMDQVAIDKKIPARKRKNDDKTRQISQSNANSSTDLIEENGALFPEQRRRESSSDENSCSYTKYEKEEPDLRGPIKDVSQYKEYVQEYNSKYEIYNSVNKILESYRSEFLILGKELENAKGKDEEKYSNALSRLMDSYRQSGSKHLRLKKIFLVFHEELKRLKEMIKDFAATYTKD